MYPLRALALLTLFASSSIAEPLRPSRSAGFHHTSSFGSEYSKSFSSGFGGEGLASEPIVQTKASYKGCSSATGCGGITLENGQITEKFGNPAALGLNGDVSANIDPAELHKKFALQAADINSAFAASLPSNGPFWWTSKDSPFKDTYETYLKWVKDNSFAAAPFTSPCGTSTCPFGSSFSQNKVTNTGGSNTIDIANNPFLNGQFAAGSFGATSGFTSGGATAGADLSKNPFLSGNVHSDGVNGQGGSTSFSSSFGTTGVSGPGINIQNNPFLNGAIATTGCGGKSTGCSQTTSFQQTTGTGAKPGFDVLNLDSNPFLSKPSGSIHVTGSSTTGCGGAACGGGTQITGFEQQQITTGFGGQAQQVTTGFGTTGLQNQQQITTGFGQIKPSGCGGTGCQGQQQITSNFQQTQDNSCSGPFCGQEQQTHQAFPPPPAPSNKPSGSNLPHPPGIAGQGFKETNVGGELTVTCIGEGNICVKKEQCVNGIVSNYGENILQLRSGIRCPISTEVCCKIKEKAPQTTSQTFTNSFQSTVGQNVQSTVGQNVQSTIGQNVQSTHPTGPGFQTPPSGNEQHFTSHSSGLIHVPGVPGEKHFGFEQQSYNQISGKPSKDVRPPLTGPGSTSIYKDSVVSQSEQQFSSPIFGNVQKQGTPYLPPVEDQKVKPYEYPEPENPYNPELIPFPTQPAPAKPTPYKPQPTPYQPQPTPAKPKPIPNQPQPTPYQPQPTPYQPQPTPYQPQPTPYKPQPTPYKPQPTPYQPQPTPNKPQPTPYVPKQPQPTPYQPQPTPYQPQPTPYQPQPTPYQPQPTPYQPQPTPYKPQPTPYQPKPTPYSPPVQRPTPSIKGPGYLPPPDESPQSSIGSQQIVPRPGDSEGGIILDETRDQRPKDNPIPIIPSGCAAALKCTPKEFCTADGIISNSTVRLTQAQEEFRVPLTDCKEPSTGVVGKCCRDPTYTDPWPTNQLGQWIPGAFGDTGAYKADQNRGIPPRGSNGANPQNDNRRPPPNNGFGLNPAGSINNPIYAANPNQVVPPKPGQYPSNQARPNNPAAQPNIPPNPAIYQNQQQNFPTGPSYPTGSQVNPGKATYPNTPVARPNGFPVGPTGISSPSNTPGSQVNTENLYTTGQLLLEEFQNAKNQNKQGSCGVRQGGTRPLGNKELFETDFGEIPWQAMILLQTNRTLLCGGVITSENIVVTSAHCIDGLDAKNVLVKGGEWKLGIDEEPRPFQIVQVSKIIKHPQYFTGSLQNDFAVLVLSEKLRYAPNIAPICLPPATQDANQRLYQNGGKYKCITTGWGKKVLQVNVPNSIMHSLDMSLISPPQCQAQISQNYPHLLENYDANTCICGQPSQVSANVCQVDIGSALACTSGDGAYYMEGVFSWDSGCQSSNQLAAFYKFDSFWYQSVSEGGNVQSSLFEQQQITNGFPGQPKPATQLGSYSTQSKQTVTKHGQSYAVNGQDAFNQSLGLGHAHTGAQCQCFEEGKK